MARVRSEALGAETPVLVFGAVPDTLALACWLHKDALIAALDREIANEADDASALSHEARQQAEAEVMGDLLATERQEAFADMVSDGAEVAGRVSQRHQPARAALDYPHHATARGRAAADIGGAFMAAAMRDARPPKLLASAGGCAAGRLAWWSPRIIMNRAVCLAAPNRDGALSRSSLAGLGCLLTRHPGPPQRE